jgi:hypothetical protein
VLLGTTTIALAASGVILTGSNVPTLGRLRPGYELGVPVRGGSELSGRSGFAAAIAGLPPSAVGFHPSAASNTSANVSRATLREISFGLLGEHARKIAYRSEDGVKTAEVLPGLGAYLIVQRAMHGGQLGDASESSAPAGDPVDPDGTLTAITYSYGKRTCKVVGHGNALSACGFSEGPLKAKPLPLVHVALHVQLEVHDHTITAAYVVFRAPYPVTSAAENYSVDSYGCKGILSGEGSHYNVAKGAILHISIASVLSNACSRSVKIAVDYTRSIDDNLAFTALGKVTAHIPRGDHA